MTLGVQALITVGTSGLDPLGLPLTNLIEQIEVNEVADGQSGFRISFSGARSGSGAGSDYAVLSDSRVALFERVRISVGLGADWTVLMDGLITNIWTDPGRGGGASQVVVTGSDLTVAMDREEKTETWEGRNEADTVLEIIMKYAKYGLFPIRALGGARLDPKEETPTQRGTDLNHIYELADLFGYVFALYPGTPTVAYWGPPQPDTLPLPALSADTGTLGNVNHLTFTYDGMAASSVSGMIKDPSTGAPTPISSTTPGVDSLASASAFTNTALVRKLKLAFAGGMTDSQAAALARGVVRRSAKRVVRGQGEVSSLAYGGVMHAGKIIGVRGAGASFDGDYLIEQVSHTLERGKYLQSFTIARDGTGSTTPLVRFK